MKVSLSRIYTRTWVSFFLKHLYNKNHKFATYTCCVEKNNVWVSWPTHVIIFYSYQLQQCILVSPMGKHMLDIFNYVFQPCNFEVQFNLYRILQHCLQVWYLDFTSKSWLLVLNYTIQCMWVYKRLVFNIFMFPV